MPATTQPTSAVNALDASLDKSRAKQGVSVTSFLASTLVCFASFTIQICLFYLLRHRHFSEIDNQPVDRRWYYWLWAEISQVWHDCFSVGYHFGSVKKVGPDGFFHMRYLTVLLKIFVPFSIVLTPALIPLNVIHGRGEAASINGLDRLSWANIPSTETNRYWAHAILAVMADIYVCFIVWIELALYSGYTRDSMLDDDKPCANTVLLASIPTAYRNKSGVELLLRGFQDKICGVWMNRDCSDLVQKIEQQRRVAQSLEAAETSLMRRALEAWQFGPGERLLAAEEEKSRVIAACKQTIWPEIPFKGRKVDEIHYWRGKYVEATVAVREERGRLQGKPVSGSAFVQFSHAAAAHAVRQIVIHHHPGSVIPVSLFYSPDEVVWENTSIDWVRSIYRSMIVKGCMMVLVFLFAVPVAFAGTLSQITSLFPIVPGLAWLNSLPEWSLGVIQGVIPPAILACLLWSLSTILRKLAVAHGAPSRQALEEVVQEYYFRFLFIQLFFIVVVTSGFVSVKSNMEQGLVATLDAIIRAVPQASNYFLSYLILQGVSISGSTLLQMEDILRRLMPTRLLDRTPTQQKRQAEGLHCREWGVHFPTYAALAGIGFIYSVISPLILSAEVFCFALILVTHRYVAVHEKRRCFDAGAPFYPHAIKHLLTGLYGMQAVLFFLFLLVTNSDEELACIWQAMFVALGAICTFFFNRVVERTFNSLFHYLPAVHFPRNEFGGTRAPPLTGEQAARDTDWHTFEYPSGERSPDNPTISIPRDAVGFSRIEIEDAMISHPEIVMEDEEATMNMAGNVILVCDSSQ